MSGPVWPGNSYAQSGRALVLTHFQTEHIDLHRFEQFLADPCNLSDLHFQHFCTYHQRLWTVKNCYLLIYKAEFDQPNTEAEVFHYINYVNVNYFISFQMVFFKQSGILAFFVFLVLI